MTKNTQGSEWEKRFDELMKRFDWKRYTIVGTGEVGWEDNEYDVTEEREAILFFIASERQALLQKVREWIKINSYEDNDYGIKLKAVWVDELLSEIDKLESGINGEPLSNCCKAPLKVCTGNEGTSYYECTRCLRAADREERV